MALIRESSLGSFPGSVSPDLSQRTDAAGQFAFTIDDTNPTYDSFYVFSASAEHFNQIFDGVESTLSLPLVDDFFLPGVVALDGSVSNPNVDFTLRSNRTTEKGETA